MARHNSKPPGTVAPAPPPSGSSSPAGEATLPDGSRRLGDSGQERTSRTRPPATHNQQSQQRPAEPMLGAPGEAPRRARPRPRRSGPGPACRSAGRRPSPSRGGLCPSHASSPGRPAPRRRPRRSAGPDWLPAPPVGAERLPIGNAAVRSACAISPRPRRARRGTGQALPSHSRRRDLACRGPHVRERNEVEDEAEQQRADHTGESIQALIRAAFDSSGMEAMLRPVDDPVSLAAAGSSARSCRQSGPAPKARPRRAGRAPRFRTGYRCRCRRRL